MMITTKNKSSQEILDDRLESISENKNKFYNKDPNKIKIGISSIFNTPLYTIQNGLAPRYKHTYIALDRRSLSIESADYKTFTWNITHRKDNRDSGTIYLPPDIKNIRQLRIMPFKFNTDMTSTNLQIANMPFTVNIPELTQGFTVGGERFQFMGKPIFTGLARTSDMIIVFDKNNKHKHDNLLPVDPSDPNYYVDNSSYNQGIFTLEDNFTFTNTISLQFGFPFKKLALKQSRFPITSQATLSNVNSIPTQFNISNPNSVSATADTFYIENLSYSNPTPATNKLALAYLGNNDLGWRGTISNTVNVTADPVQPYLLASKRYRFYNYMTGPYPDVSNGSIYSARLGFEICFEIIYEV